MKTLTKHLFFRQNREELGDSMKRIIVFFGLMFSFSSLFILSGGCGSDNLTTVLNANFFPLNVGDTRNLRRTTSQGTIGDFTQTVEAQTTLNGKSVFPFTTRDTQGAVVRIDYYGSDSSSGISVCGFDDFENNFSSRYEPCIFMPFLGTGQNQSGTVQVTGGGGLASAVTADFVVSVVSFGEQTVPAGTFDNCAESTIRVTNKDSGGTVVEDGLFTSTLCPNIGGIRLSHEGLSIGDATSVLTSAVVGGKAIL